MSPDTTNRLRCALVQADTRWADQAANRCNLEALMDRAPGCDLYVLPETCTTGFLGDRDAGSLEREAAADYDWLRRQSEQRRAAIACSIVASDGGQLFNRFVFAHPDGSATTYDKRHLFGYGGEDSERYSAGSQRVRARCAGRRFDLQVCYDLRFPVWCRNDDGFDLQIYVANWPRPRADAWCTLLAARAIENQAYVIGLNRVGVDGNGIDHPGRSGVWDAQGRTVIGPLDDSETVATVELDFAALDALRREFPFSADRDRFSLMD